MKSTEKPPAQPSPKLVRLLNQATPQQREEALRVAARLLAIRARKPKS